MIQIRASFPACPFSSITASFNLKERIDNNSVRLSIRPLQTSVISFISSCFTVPKRERISSIWSISCRETSTGSNSLPCPISNFRLNKAKRFSNSFFTNMSCIEADCSANSLKLRAIIKDDSSNTRKCCFNWVSLPDKNRQADRQAVKGVSLSPSSWLLRK